MQIDETSVEAAGSLLAQSPSHPTQRRRVPERDLPEAPTDATRKPASGLDAMTHGLALSGSSVTDVSSSLENLPLVDKGCQPASAWAHLNRICTLHFMGTTEGTLSVSDGSSCYPELLKVPRKFLIFRWPQNCQGSGVGSIPIGRSNL